MLSCALTRLSLGEKKDGREVLTMDLSSLAVNMKVLCIPYIYCLESSVSYIFLFIFSRYCSGEDAIYIFRMSLVDNVLVKLLWHDFLIYSEARHADANTSKLLDKNLLDIKQGQLHDLGRCIIDVLSALYSLECKLLTPFCEAFQGCCLETFQQAEHVKEASGNIGKAIRFLVLVEEYVELKSESWPLDYLVGPMLERSLPLIISHVSFMLVSISLCL